MENSGLTRTKYDEEIDRLASTYQSALTRDLAALKAAIAGASESSIIGVGSGASFTVASLLCKLHETYTGRVSRAATPLEIICNPTLAASSPVFLISSEGGNPDITEALQRARLHSSRPIHVLSNRNTGPLADRIAQLTDVTKHVFELDIKDGYLATNSLLLNSALIARAYGELDAADERLPQSVDDLRVGSVSIAEWAAQADEFAKEAVTRGSLIVTYSPLLLPIATDLESKLSEAALLHCQLADLRSFAHGRHLWLAKRREDCAILALIEPSLKGLWDKTKSLLPADVPTLTMPLAGSTPRELITGLVAEMRLISRIAAVTGEDPGKPDVPDFGRSLYYLDLPSVIAEPVDSASPVSTKNEVLGARWPWGRTDGAMQRALDTFKKDIQRREFRAIVFDYDGTLCSSQRHEQPPTDVVLEHLSRLMDAGIAIGIASGRGGSIQEFLSTRLSDKHLSQLTLGLYNGGWISDARVAPTKSEVTSEFLNHVTRIATRLKSLGVPIERIRTTHPYQVSIRFRDGLSTEHMWFVIADALRQAGLDLGSMVRSKHSIDVLAGGVNKSRLIAEVIQAFAVEPYDVLTIGDQGAWPGNDSSLLEHRFSLSVDAPSRHLDRGWKLAPSHKRYVDATLWYLERVLLNGKRFSLSLSDG